jgi:uncharacterized protein YyaL (SSP411 family)
MVSCLVKLHILTGEQAYEERARAVIDAFAPDVSRGPLAFAGLMAGLIDLEAPQQLVIVRGAMGEVSALERAARTLALPGALIQVVDRADVIPAGSAAVGKRPAVAGRPTAYLCTDRTCLEAITEARELVRTARAARFLRLVRTA